MIRVLVADDQPLMRAGLRMVFEPEPDIGIVGEADDGLQAVALAQSLRPDVVMMDIRMPRLDGIAATERITGRRPQSDTRVLILTTFDTDEHVYRALRAGASGFLLKDAPPEHLVAGVRVVAAGDALLAPSVTRRLIEGFVQGAAPPVSPLLGQDELTERELEVLRLVAQGLSNLEIGERLHLAESTVKSHVGGILAKLGMRDRVQAVVAAYESGLVRPGDRLRPE